MRPVRYILITIAAFCGLSIGPALFAAEIDPVNLADEVLAATTIGNGATDSQSITLISFADYIFHRRQTDPDQLILDAEKAQYPHIDIFRAYLALSKLSTGDFQEQTEFDTLIKASENNDWERSFFSNIALSVLYLKNGENSPGQYWARQAVEVIPTNDGSIRVKNARFEAMELMHNAFGLDSNLPAMLDATQKLLEISKDIDRDIDEFSIVHNMALLLVNEHDYQTASALSQRLIDSDLNLSPQNMATAQAIHGRILSKQNLNADAIYFLEEALEYFEGIYLQDALEITLATAYLRTGDTIRATEIVDAIMVRLKNGSDLKPMNRATLGILEAEIAYTNGDFKKAAELNTKWRKVESELLYESIRSDRRKSNADLLLSQELSSQKIESQLVQARLKSEISQRNFAFLISIVLILGCLTLFLLMNSRKLQRMNTEIDTARVAALEGEKAKARFLAVMSHEVRTPLNAIIPLTNVLLTQLKDDKSRSLLSLINNAGNHLLSMVENILILSKGTDEHEAYFESSDIKTILVDTLKAHKQEIMTKRIKVAANIDPDIPQEMNFDGKKVQKILHNILSNAVKFNRTDGNLAIKAGFSSDRDSVRISITDNGHGFDMAILPELMKPFSQADMSFTRSFEGAGIGLAVTKIYADTIGAELTFNSIPEQGTVVTLTLPVTYHRESREMQPPRAA